MRKTTAHAFTLIEVILVVALIGIASFPLIRNAQQSAQTQNLRTSVAVFSDDLQTAKVSSREARDKKAWGVVSQSNNTYLIVKGTPQSYTADATHTLENGVTFVQNFSVWFELGTGNTQVQSIEIQNKNGKSYKVLLNNIGTITTQLQ